MPSKPPAKRKRKYAPGSRAGVGGRKPRDDSGHGKPLYVRLTRDERAAVERGAEAAGAEPGHFARRAVLEAAQKALRIAALQEST